MARGIPSATGLTRQDVATGPRFYIVGVRPSGTRLVLGDARTREAADKLRDHLLKYLDGYAQIIVERVGEAIPRTKGNTHAKG